MHSLFALYVTPRAACFGAAFGNTRPHVSFVEGVSARPLAPAFGHAP